MILLASSETVLLTALSTVVVTLMGALTAAYVQMRKLRSEIRHTEADSNKTDSEAQLTTATAADTVLKMALTQLESVTARLDKTDAELVQSRQSVRRLHGRVDILEDHLEELEKMLRRAGLEPPPRPSYSLHTPSETPRSG